VGKREELIEAAYKAIREVELPMHTTPQEDDRLAAEAALDAILAGLREPGIAALESGGSIIGESIGAGDEIERAFALEVWQAMLSVLEETSQ